ncbi:MAG: hypothetical protein GYA12_06180 [Chloroflexi bacterium]|nr:hypothetical protein [Chloroflexota bacterium]
MRTFNLGDEYTWVPRKAPQNGGRPFEGNLDGEGYAECPVCRKGFYVKVAIRNDRIESVSADAGKNSSFPQ